MLASLSYSELCRLGWAHKSESRVMAAIDFKLKDLREIHVRRTKPRFFRLFGSSLLLFLYYRMKT